MNPLVSSLIGAGVRWLVTVAAARGIAVSDSDAAQITLGVVTTLPLLWSWWQKHQADQKLKTAQLQAALASHARNIA